MGTKIKEIITSEEITLDDLSGKTLAVDSFNILYQFLTTIRQRDGSPLMDSKARITSHLSGLFNRTVDLLEKDIKEIFVFDGKSPDLKKKEQQRRLNIKKEADLKLMEARAEGNKEEIRKYAGRTARLTSEMIEESKKLIKALGLPVVQAPAEGEAQASEIVKLGKAYAVASEDFDSLIFGAPILIKNLSISGKRKKTKTLGFITIKPKRIILSEVLNKNSIDQEQLIAIAMLVGTDFNIGGIPQIGIKKSKELIKKFGKDFDSMFKECRWDDYFDVSWYEVFNLIKNMPKKKEFDLKFTDPNIDEIKNILVKNHDFNEERIDSKLSRLLKRKAEKNKEKSQSSLNKWF